MSDNPLDLAYAEELRKLELQQGPARDAFDELARIIADSQTPSELGFGFGIGDREMSFAKGEYLITAKLDGPAISVSVKRPEASSHQQNMMAMFSSIYRPTADAREAANQIGALMARVIENRFL